MKFSLIFDGDLRPNGGVPEKWDIRKQIHPQLEELWRVNPSLKFVQRHSKIDTKGYWFIESHHSLDDYSKPSPEPTGDYLDLCEPIVRGGRKFFPLVRDSFALKSSLRISFLRKEEPGKVYQAGDLDNRLKTLFDALAVPKKNRSFLTKRS